MRTLEFSYSTTVAFSEPVLSHDFVLRCLPRSTDGQTVRARVDIAPEVPFDVQTDSFGNSMAVGTVLEPHDRFSFTTVGTAVVDHAARKPQVAHPLFRYESKLTAMTPEMLAFLADAASDGMRKMVLGNMGAESSPVFTCEHLMHMVHATLKYAPGSTTVETTASQAFEQGKGVCQDFAHVLIALIRACRIPARYVSGLTVGEGATHAWVEANLAGSWIGLDPTRDQLVDESYLRLAVGRDWSDCPIERGTFQGFAQQTQSVFASVADVTAE